MPERRNVMTIVSLAFLLFVALALVLYFVIPLRYRWIVLLAASYVFYWLNSRWLVFVLLGMTAVSYLIGLWIQRVNDKGAEVLKSEGVALSKEARKEKKNAVKKASRRILVLGVLAVLSCLLFLKYYNFLGGSLNHLLNLLGVHGNPVPHLGLLVPLGISFYTLQAISYMTDVYREKIRADRNPFRFMLYMSFFPQIIQGPIPRHSDLAHQLYEGHRFDYRNLCFGTQLILFGMIKKLVIADRLAVFVQTVSGGYKSLNGAVFFFAAVLYGFQVYADFSGGMDIARGVAETMGIRLSPNFNQPYFATSVENFWRRWHMTLGAWMKDYVFYPLSLSKAFTKLGRGSRKVFGPNVGKKIPSLLAMFIVFLLVGFWHGSSWKYVAFGLWNSLFIMSGILLQNFYQRARQKLGIREGSVLLNVFRMIRTFVIVTIGRFFTFSGSLMAALSMLKRFLTRFWDFSFLGSGMLVKNGLRTADWIVILCGLILLFTVDVLHEKKIGIRMAIAKRHIAIRWVVYLAAIVLLVLFGLYGQANSASAFIYEQF